jgi:hypothetical protein
MEEYIISRLGVIVGYIGGVAAALLFIWIKDRFLDK